MCTKYEMSKKVLFEYFNDGEEHVWSNAVAELDLKLKGYIPVFGDSAARQVNKLIDAQFLEKVESPKETGHRSRTYILTPRGVSESKEWDKIAAQ